MSEQTSNQLSDEDAEKIAAALEKRLIGRFHVNLGKGVWKLAWRAIVFGLIVLAIYGATNHGGTSVLSGIHG